MYKLLKIQQIHKDLSLFILMLLKITAYSVPWGIVNVYPHQNFIGTCITIPCTALEGNKLVNVLWGTSSPNPSFPSTPPTVHATHALGLGCSPDPRSVNFWCTEFELLVDVFPRLYCTRRTLSNFFFSICNGTKYIVLSGKLRTA